MKHPLYNRDGYTIYTPYIRDDTPEDERTKRALEQAVVNGADLMGVNLDHAKLNHAILDGARLDRASLNHAILDHASLDRARLDGAILDHASLVGARLNHAILDGARLDRASLNHASLVDASLVDASLNGVAGLHFQIPDGDLIVWKKVQGRLVQLRIPKEARRTSTPTGRKCRAEWAEVLWIEEGGPVTSRLDCIYVPGQLVEPDGFDPDWRVACSYGIHFFLTREEAEEW